MNPPSASPPALQFLKLGGSLITEKSRPQTARPAALARLAGEISEALSQNPSLRLILGHGSGSFGHVSGNRYGTRQGVRTPQGWRGFAEVWWDASSLNRLVMAALQAVGLPAVAFPPSAAAIARDARVASWDFAPLQAALEAGLLPVVYGDVAFDSVRGGTILSTEDLFAYLAERLEPGRLLLAGIEPGVWADYPACTRLIPEITPSSWNAVAPLLGGSGATDVTGGMAGKVSAMLALVERLPALEVLIFSGETPGLVQAALGGAQVGTRIHL